MASTGSASEGTRNSDFGFRNSELFFLAASGRDLDKLIIDG